MYDATDYAANLFNCPTVAYSGEIDRQIQAARMMEKALTAEGHELEARHRSAARRTAIIPTPRSRSPASSMRIAEKGRDPYPRKIRFTTFTLRVQRDEVGHDRCHG